MSVTTPPLFITSPTVQKPHVPLGIVQGYAQHQLGFGSRIGASLTNLFGGNTFNSNIAKYFQQVRKEALQNLKQNTANDYPTAQCVINIRFELLTMEINRGNDTLLVCSVSGTPIRFRKDAPAFGTFGEKASSKTAGGAATSNSGTRLRNRRSRRKKATR
jgi:uncharacterized protein YbjQ (UPF0145 family)